jgi:hypothetical protein
MSYGASNWLRARARARISIFLAAQKIRLNFSPYIAVYRRIYLVSYLSCSCLLVVFSRFFKRQNPFLSMMVSFAQEQTTLLRIKIRPLFEARDVLDRLFIAGEARATG